MVWAPTVQNVKKKGKKLNNRVGSEQDSQNKRESKVSYKWQSIFRKQFDFYSYSKRGFTYFLKELLKHNDIEMSNPNLIRDDTNNDLILNVNFQIKANENDDYGKFLFFIFYFFFC